MDNKKKPDSFSERLRQIFKKSLPLLIGTIIVLFVVGLLFNTNEQPKFGYNEFIQTVKDDKMLQVTIEPQDNAYRLNGKFKDNKKFILNILKEDKFDNLELSAFLNKYNVKFTIKEKSSSTLSFLLMWGPFAIIFFFVFRMLNAQQKVGKADKFTGATPRNKIGAKAMFKDVAGLKEAKEELQEVIDYLKSPAKFSKLGGRVPRGVLLVGPAGSGKTLLARAVAGEAEANFLSMSGSEFVELFVGVGAGRVRDLFNKARKNTPAIVFIDELDAVGRSRGAGLGGGHDEREQTLNQLLVELDGFDQSEGIVLLAATNRPDILDAALLRPGRFDRKVYTNLPDIEDRESILRVHTRNKPLADNVDLKIIARGTPGFSGADLENLTNEAALRAAKKGKEKIDMEDIEWAKDKVLMGAEKKIIITEEEKRITAYHEVGHALTSLLCPDADPLHKVSIIPRGQALGVTIQLPLQDKYLYSKEELDAKLVVFMGGRVAEEMFFNKKTTGASNDIEIATEIARKMVCRFGMSDLGPLNFGQKEGEVFLGMDIVQTKNYSDDTAKKIDEEVRKIIENAHNNALNIIEKNKDKVEKIVELLLKKETLNGEEIKKLLNIESKTAE